MTGDAEMVSDVPRSGVSHQHPHPGGAGVGSHLRQLAPAGFASGRQVPLPASNTTSQPDEPGPSPMDPHLS